MYCCPPGDVRTTSARCSGGATSDGLGATGTYCSMAACHPAWSAMSFHASRTKWCRAKRRE
eukprot:1880777-Amphidinium_carterae.1